MKDDFDEDEATALVSCVNKNDRWIIDSGVHITCLEIKVSSLP